jgi:hypothetical protein
LVALRLVGLDVVVALVTLIARNAVALDRVFTSAGPSPPQAW